MHSLIRQGCPVFDRTPFFARGPVVPFSADPEPERMHVRCVPFPFPRRSPSARDLSPVARSEVCYFYRRPPSSHAPAVASPIAFPCRRLRSPLPRRRFIARSVARPVVAPRRTLCRLGSLPVPPVGIACHPPPCGRNPPRSSSPTDHPTGSAVTHRTGPHDAAPAGPDGTVRRQPFPAIATTSARPSDDTHEQAPRGPKSLPDGIQSDRSAARQSAAAWHSFCGHRRTFVSLLNFLL